MDKPVIEPINADTLLSIAEASTLSGDIRDALLTHLRTIRVPWAMLAEDEQAACIYQVEHAAEAAVRRIANIVAANHKPHVVGTINKYTVKNDIRVEFNVTSLVANICALAEHGKAGAVLVLANAADFIGERAPAKPDPDQRELPIDKAA